MRLIATALGVWYSRVPCGSEDSLQSFPQYVEKNVEKAHLSPVLRCAFALEPEPMAKGSRK
jgi:hypothetical protein